MEYGIHPLSTVSGAYVWRYSDLDIAKDHALKLVREHNVEVVVFQIVGTYKPAAEWVPCKVATL